MTIDELWNSTPSGPRTVRSNDLSELPDAARRYLEHAIALGTPLASAVRLRMHGEIKLRRWSPFKAEQVISWGHGFIWGATAWMNGLPIRGFDRLVAGEGAMRWKLFGILPVMTASGPDITRSAAGRLMTESVWLPSALYGTDVRWTELDPFHPRARLTVLSEAADLTLTIGDRGELLSVSLPRWGNPGGMVFGSVDFGGVIEEEGTFGGYTVPTRLRVGYRPRTDRVEWDGEFIRVRIDDAVYR